MIEEGRDIIQEREEEEELVHLPRDSLRDNRINKCMLNNSSQFNNNNRRFLSFNIIWFIMSFKYIAARRGEGDRN